MIQRLCKNCMSAFTAYNSLQTKCGLCQYNKLGRPRKPMKRIGKVGKQWIEDRKTWIEDNPPDHYGLWRCYLRIADDCHRTMTIETLNVEHKESRVRRPDLRSEQANLDAACPPCNELKGSRSATEFDARNTH